MLTMPHHASEVWEKCESPSPDSSPCTMHFRRIPGVTSCCPPPPPQLPACCSHRSASRAWCFSQEPKTELSDATMAWRLDCSLEGKVSERSRVEIRVKNNQRELVQ